MNGAGPAPLGAILGHPIVARTRCKLAGDQPYYHKEIVALLYVIAIVFTSTTVLPQSVTIVANPFHGMDSS